MKTGDSVVVCAGLLGAGQKASVLETWTRYDEAADVWRLYAHVRWERTGTTTVVLADSLKPEE